MNNIQEFYNRIKKRYRAIELEAVLVPIVIPIHEIDKTIHKGKGQSHWKAKFRIRFFLLTKSI